MGRPILAQQHKASEKEGQSDVHLPLSYCSLSLAPQASSAKADHAHETRKQTQTDDPASMHSARPYDYTEAEIRGTAQSLRATTASGPTSNTFARRPTPSNIRDDNDTRRTPAEPNDQPSSASDNVAARRVTDPGHRVNKEAERHTKSE
ncbi:hypothetical protein WOLCODRAFT_141827 [Wolfiporia cocos MD-104 SS10]|uniref:Uncharacterized protein n=1 Tax=Wolfiporia cocos (strain MD-104) TaxID=742152 RepID=A0A2H3IVS6_WOLCO|nr:hypothetical protein WOLCODRAFT_141827 [Wolfiporia cocos MD-104 SS10]